MRSNGNHSLIIPRNVWALGIVSLLMDLSSEMILSILPIFLVTGLNLLTTTNDDSRYYMSQLTALIKCMS